MRHAVPSRSGHAIPVRRCRPRLPRWVRRLGTPLLQQQLWCWGWDIRRDEGNVLLEYGFTRQRPVTEEDGCSAYTLALPSAHTIILWGFGLFYSDDEVGGLFVKRHGFAPQLMLTAEPPSTTCSLFNLPPLRGPRTAEKWVPGCFGARATIVGTEQQDSLQGTNGDDVIVALGGDDRIDGKGGHDRLCGDAGKDGINGGDGNDQIDGGKGDDKLQGGKGDDLLLGGAGADNIEGGDGNDQVEGGDDNDKIQGRNGDDDLDGGAGIDSVDGGDGTDLCTSGEKVQRCES